MSDPIESLKTIEDEIEEDDTELLCRCYEILQVLSLRRMNKTLTENVKGLLSDLEAALTFITIH